MKIVVIHSHASILLDEYGPVLKSMADLGHTVHALAPLTAEDSAALPDAPGGEPAAPFEALGTEYAMFPLAPRGFTPGADISSMLHLKQVLFRVRPDLVFAAGDKAMLYGPMAARMAWVGEQKRVFALVERVSRDFHRGSGLKRRLLFQIAKSLHRAGFKSCDGLLFRDAGDQGFFRQLGVIPEHVRTGVLDKEQPVDRAILSFLELI